jgi:signal transduction histidine kinase
VLRDDSGKAVRMLGVVQDTTRRKQLERDLATQKEYAVQANSAKSEFLSRMSHELRTPLNAIIGFAQLLESDEQQPLHESQLDSLHEILKAGNHLLDLIDEVLDLAKIEAGKIQLHIEDMPVIDVMLESYSMMIPMAESKTIHLDFNVGQGEDIFINADRTKLKQVMFNLMSNAIKYNQPEGKVTVSCEACAPQRVRLEVRDTGIGIPQDRQTDLFKAFNRLGAEEGDEEGTGIGLMISKKIVEMMGGELGFYSEEGKGSVFWVEMSIVNDIATDQQLNTDITNSKMM